MYSMLGHKCRGTTVLGIRFYKLLVFAQVQIANQFDQSLRDPPRGLHRVSLHNTVQNHQTPILSVSMHVRDGVTIKPSKHIHLIELI